VRSARRPASRSRSVRSSSESGYRWQRIELVYAYRRSAAPSDVEELVEVRAFDPHRPSGRACRQRGIIERRAARRGVGPESDEQARRAAILLAVLVAWLVAPVARAYQLVAGRSSDPVPRKTSG